jgi:uncharacterized protein
VTGATGFIGRQWCRRAETRGVHLIITPARRIESSARIDAIVNLDAAPTSRIDTTNEVVDLIGRLVHKPAVLVSLSSIDYYGARGTEEVTEADRGRPTRESQVCQIWELAARRAPQYGVRECRLRAGLVLGTTSHQESTPWIHIADLLRMIDRALADVAWSGAFNATSPECMSVVPLKARWAGFEFEYPVRSRTNRKTTATPAVLVP